MSDDEPNAWRYAPAPARTPGFCPHGGYPCPGNPAAGVPPCAADEHHFCAHGFDRKRTTREQDPLCPYCRGVSARRLNHDTFSPRLPRRTPE